MFLTHHYADNQNVDGTILFSIRRLIPQEATGNALATEFMKLIAVIALYNSA
jgi:hypothetical protein